MSNLYYLMGPSGAGKDSVLDWLRASELRPASLQIAHRYLTRPISTLDENYIYLTNTEFEQRKAQGLFLLDWESHQTRYAIGCEVETWLNQGIDVILNGSRAYFEQALSQYPALKGLYLDVDDGLLEQRLRARGRDSERSIQERLSMAKDRRLKTHPAVINFSNNEALADSGQKLIELLQS